MRAKLLLGLLLLGLLIPGCTSKPGQKAAPPAKPAIAEEGAPPSTSEPGLSDDDAEIDALLQEAQELEEFLSEVESGDMLDTGI